GVCSRDMPDEIPPRVVAALSFIGRGGGAVKSLGGFRKGHHTLPDAINPATTAFLARLCAPEVGEAAERLFQAARAELGYKRREIGLGVGAGVATLTAKDFVLDWAWTLAEDDPARYAVTTTLHDLGALEFIRREAVSRLFAGQFTEISFAFTRSASVEAVIDAIEGLEAETPLTVGYPSDCAHCVIRVEGVEAEVRC